MAARVVFYKEIYVFFEFLGALPVCFWTFLGAKSVRGVMGTHKPDLKSISKAKTSIFTFSCVFDKDEILTMTLYQK